MIHIENINITVNAQALSDEAETTHTLDFELLKARIDSLFTKDEDAEEAKDAEPENQEEVQPPINAARMDSLQQQESFKQAAMPLIQWLCENVDPHHTAVVTPTNAELLEGQCTTGQVMDFVKD